MSTSFLVNDGKGAHDEQDNSRNERAATDRDVAARYSVTTRSIDRWRKDPDLAFPQPIYINDRKYWSLADLEKWERERTPHRHPRWRQSSLAGKPPAVCIANRRGQS